MSLNGLTDNCRTTLLTTSAREIPSVTNLQLKTVGHVIDIFICTFKNEPPFITECFIYGWVYPWLYTEKFRLLKNPQWPGRSPAYLLEDSVDSC